jgi:hypothetical protein
MLLTRHDGRGAVGCGWDLISATLQLSSKHSYNSNSSELALDFAGLRLQFPSQAPQLKVRSTVVSKVDV